MLEYLLFPQTNNAICHAYRSWLLTSFYVFVYGPDPESSLHPAFYAGMAE